MRTYIGERAVYCAGSGRWLSAIPNLVRLSSERVRCPECGEPVRVSRVNETVKHFAPYRVGADGRRLSDAS